MDLDHLVSRTSGEDVLIDIVEVKVVVCHSAVTSSADTGRSKVMNILIVWNNAIPGC